MGNPEGKHAFWHSSAHLMAEALEQLYPGVKFGIGPAIENGFYYDVDLGDRVLSESDLIDIEKKCMSWQQKNQPTSGRDQQRRGVEAFWRKR